jgi:hypothetical protein
MNADSILEKIRLQNRKRQATYYSLHKDTINAKKREIYKNGKAKLIHQDEDEKEENQEAIQTNFSKKRSVTYDEVVLALNKLDINENTKKKYKQDLQRLMTLTNCNNNIIKCFREHKKIIEIINTATKPNEEPYSINTKKSLFQMILYLIDKLHLPITKTIKEHYKKQFEIYKISSSDETAEKQANTTIISFDDYLKKVKDEFGVKSKEYALSSLYKEVTLRDDFILKIVTSIKETQDKKENYIIVPKRGNLNVIVNNYKTSQKYGEINVKLSTTLSKLIGNFIKVEKLKNNDYLFGNKNLTQFVSKMNKKINVSGSISLFRQMAVSDLLKTNPSPEERVALSNSMKHSPIVQLKYLRKIN